MLFLMFTLIILLVALVGMGIAFRGGHSPVRRPDANPSIRVSASEHDELIADIEDFLRTEGATSRRDE